MHMESIRLRRIERELLAQDRKRRRHVSPEIRAARSALNAELDSVRRASAQQDALERQAPYDEAAKIIVKNIDGEELHRLLTLLPRLTPGNLTEAIKRLS